MFEHEHPLNLIDLWLKHINNEEESDEDDGKDLVTKQDFECKCDRCGEKINWYHRYYYRCDQCHYSIHKFCKDLPATLEHPSHVAHTLILLQREIRWSCNICRTRHDRHDIRYRCSECNFDVDVKCATKWLKTNIIYHPSHIHPLVCTPKKIICECDACGKEHKGEYENLWIYKCEKCRYYAHLDCATYRGEPFMSILTSPGTGKLVKNYEDDEYPYLLHLPFPDQSYSLLKHLFYKEIGSQTNEVTQTHISHQHPLILVDVTMPSSSRINKLVSYHNPMKKIQVLCNGCVRPITNPPFYMCANNEDEHCNFVLHEWCTRLPPELNHHPGHPQHPLVYHPKTPVCRSLGVFRCDICFLQCNGFVYGCVECDYYVDVCCAFIPEKVTHKAHPNHLLSRVDNRSYDSWCRLCRTYIHNGYLSFSCQDCSIHLDTKCALLLSETIRHKYDKHRMKLRYYPIENHKSEYFCEICEEKLNPNISFYHCDKCVQSVHIGCAPSILESETCAPSVYSAESVSRFVNIKFGGIHKITQLHHHPLSFVQGIKSDGKCASCDNGLNYSLILKCLECNFRLHFYCF